MELNKMIYLKGTPKELLAAAPSSLPCVTHVAIWLSRFGTPDFKSLYIATIPTSSAINGLRDTKDTSEPKSRKGFVVYALAITVLLSAIISLILIPIRAMFARIDPRYRVPSNLRATIHQSLAKETGLIYHRVRDMIEQDWRARHDLAVKLQFERMTRTVAAKSQKGLIH
jgi:hypothetical protein